MQRNSNVRKVQEAPRFASLEALRGKRLIDLNVDELGEAVREKIADALTEYLEGEIKPPPEWLTRREAAEYLRVSTAQLDLLSRRDVDPLPFEQVGDSRRFNRSDLREWVRRQRKAVTP
jgi:excisionase family DNA binding protein